MKFLLTLLASLVCVCSISAAQTSRPATTQTARFTPAEIGPAPVERIDTTYQWSLSLPNPVTDRRAYLWIPRDCKRVKGVVVGLQNMLEKLMFQNGDFRDGCAAADLAILYIAPAGIGKENDPALSGSFKDAKAATAQLDQILAGLAEVSGYPEIARAPLIPVAHSAATPFGWGYTWANPQRCIAFIPFKGWYQGAPSGVPFLHVSSEWAEVGGPKWGITWNINDRKSLLNLRAGNGDPLIGEYVEVGNGHYAWQPDSAKILSMFLKKVVAARVPANAAADGHVTLNKLPIESGVLVDAFALGTATYKAYPCAQYPGDNKGAYWYIDAEMADAINAVMAPKLAKKPQVVDGVINGQPAPLDKRGNAELRPVLQPDGITWKMQACFLDIAPPQLRFGSKPLGHAEGPAFFRLGSGALKEVAPGTFRVWLERGGIERQGNPWDPWVIAVQPGDHIYRAADRPIHFVIDIRRKDGQPQSIDFPMIANAHRIDQTVPLAAMATSKLPIQYYIISGPAEVDETGASLRLLPIPAKAKFPVKVTVGAYQWGRGVDPKFASADPVVREFEIQR